MVMRVRLHALPVTGGAYGCMLSLLRGAILIRTSRPHKKLYISLFLLTIFGPIYYAPPGIVAWLHRARRYAIINQANETVNACHLAEALEQRWR